MDRHTRWALLAVVMLVAGCGSGGGDDDGPDVLPTPSPTPRVQATTLFVRAGAGDDANLGLDPASAVRTIGAALAFAVPGDTIVVGPGVYAEVVDVRDIPDDAPLTLLANPAGDLTGDAPGPVVVEAGTAPAGIRVTSMRDVVVEGFEVRGGSIGINVRSGAHNAVIRHCDVRDSSGDGIRVQDSDDVTLFNNLIINTGRRGIALVGSEDGSRSARVVSNTLVSNARGITIGTSEIASTDAFLRNNLLDNNGRGIQVTDPALPGYNGDFNLVDPPSYIGNTPPGPNDVNAPPRFVGDFFLAQPAGGQAELSPAVDAGAPDTPGDLLGALLDVRTTNTGGIPDTGAVDIGYHHPLP